VESVFRLATHDGCATETAGFSYAGQLRGGIRGYRETSPQGLEREKSIVQRLPFLSVAPRFFEQLASTQSNRTLSLGNSLWNYRLVALKQGSYIQFFPARVRSDSDRELWRIVRPPH
jgi:hypothetical protein